MKSVTIIRMLLVAVALAACGLVGCEDDEPAPIRRELAQDEPDTASEGADAEPPRIRRAYGLPLPPQVVSVDEYYSRVVVITRMSVEELEAFYVARLTDYEVIRDGLDFQIVGLRSNMPGARGGHVSHTMGSPVELVYHPSKPVEQQALNLKGEPVELEHKPPPKDWFEKGMKGKSVDLRTLDGEVMAPGARWGEPYTPPEGSFFHQRKFKSNWGRPFGDWRVH